MDLFNKKKVSQLETEIASLKDKLEDAELANVNLANTNEHLANVLKQNGELKKQNDALTYWTEELELFVCEHDLCSLLGEPFVPDVNPVPEKKATVKKKKKVSSNAKEGIKKLEAKLKSIPDGARGTGGIDVIKNGKPVQLDFQSKDDLVKILKDAKAGKIEIASQAGL